MRFYGIMVLAAFFATLASTAHGEESNRSKKKIGGYVGILGDPAPTLLGINAAYNLTDYLRLTAGFGQVKASVTLNGASSDQSMTTLGAGAKLLYPGWSLSPVLSLGYSHVSIDAGGIVADVAANNVFMGVGMDWQAESGFNFGLGLNVAVSGASGTLPYVNLGWFF